MKIKVVKLIDKTGVILDMDDNARVMDLLKKMQIRPDSVIVLHNKVPVPVDDTLQGKEELEIIQVASGG
jgi:sulfur carrier protein ThiS